MATELPVTVVTPTGDRPECFALLLRWMERSTAHPAQWLIVDDGREPMNTRTLPPFAEYLRREASRRDPAHTEGVNWQAAIPRISQDVAIVWEDDDWYSPDYIAATYYAWRMAKRVLFGWADPIWYNVVRRKWIRYDNCVDHASMCRTAVGREAYAEWATAANAGPQTDKRLWASGATGFMVRDEQPLQVGIKGMPGRKGSTSGHRSARLDIYPGWQNDYGGDTLLQWLGNDADTYMGYGPEYRHPPVYERGSTDDKTK